MFNGMEYLFLQLHELQSPMAHVQRPFGFFGWHSVFRINYM